MILTIINILNKNSEKLILLKWISLSVKNLSKKLEIECLPKEVD